MENFLRLPGLQRGPEEAFLSVEGQSMGIVIAAALAILFLLTPAAPPKGRGPRRDKGFPYSRNRRKRKK
jgi:hypothetical protein